MLFRDYLLLVLVILCYSLLFLLGACGNLLLLVIIVSKRLYREEINTCILNMAITGCLQVIKDRSCFITYIYFYIIKKSYILLIFFSYFLCLVSCVLLFSVVSYRHQEAHLLQGPGDHADDLPPRVADALQLLCLCNSPTQRARGGASPRCNWGNATSEPIGVDWRPEASTGASGDETVLDPVSLSHIARLGPADPAGPGDV